METAEISFTGQIGHCGDREVFLGFANAADLYRVSFPDVLDEVSGKGYQRRFHREHSLEFKRYIQKAGATTIPLTFNLRPELPGWELVRNGTQATLKIRGNVKPVMAQVDCQHRLGYLRESEISLAFMTYIGLSVKEEMEVFRVINGKAKGLSGSLLDFTEAKIVNDDLKEVKPELFLALVLHEDPQSPWYKRLDLGGNRTTGPMRVASLRTMQKAAKRFLKEANLSNKQVDNELSLTVIAFWKAIALVLPEEWKRPRQHMLAKGVGVYCLMSLAGELTREAREKSLVCDIDYFVGALSDFVHAIDWSNHGPLKGFGGASGANAALELIRHVRSNTTKKHSNYGKQEYSAH